MIYDFYLFQGHGGVDNGACANGYKEIDIAYDVAEGVYQLLKNTFTIHRNTKQQNNYTNNLLTGNTYTGKFGITIHVNAGGGNGAECLVPCNESYFKIENNILNKFSGFGFANRGIKSRSYNTEQFYKRQDGKKLNDTDYYKEIRQAWSLGVSGTILELFFIDSKTDLEKYNKYKTDMIYAIANAILEYFNKPLLSKPVNKPTENVSRETYRVIAGSYKNKDNANKQVEKLKKLGIECFVEKKV